MTELLPPVFLALGTVVVGLLTFLGGRYAARQSAKAAEGTKDVQSRQVDVAEWQAILTALREEVARLSLRLDRAEQKGARDQENIQQLLAYGRSLLGVIHRIAPDHPLPTPPSAFVDELSYLTEGHSNDSR